MVGFFIDKILQKIYNITIESFYITDGFADLTAGECKRLFSRPSGQSVKADCSFCLFLANKEEKLCNIKIGMDL